MVDWVSGLTKRGLTSSKEFEQGLGRLGFASTALVWEKPFLGPLYAWSSAVQNTWEIETSCDVEDHFTLFSPAV